MKLDPRELKWARKLTRVQGEKEDLVQLLGLVNQLNGITAREASLEAAARSICIKISRHLVLDYCAFYVRGTGGLRLAADSQQPLPQSLSSLIEERVRQNAPYRQSLGKDFGARILLCLPISNHEKRMGVLVIMPGYQLHEKDHRHLRMASDAIMPVLETFLLRQKLQGLNQQLKESAEVSSRGLEMVRRRNLHAQTCLEGLIQHSEHPVFLSDAAGRLVRFNRALESFLGGEPETLKGRRIAEFIPRAEMWSPLEDALACSREVLDWEVELSVQIGEKQRALISLIPVFKGGGEVAAMGVLRRAEDRRAGSEHGRVTLPEAAELHQLCGQAMDGISDMLSAIRSNLQLLLLFDLDEKLRARISLLEELTHEQAAPLDRLRSCLEHIESRCRRAESGEKCWQAKPPGA